MASRMNTIAEVPCWEAALGLQLGAETGVREREIGERALLYRIAEKWTEEGELQCGCPHIVKKLYTLYGQCQ